MMSGVNGFASLSRANAFTPRQMRLRENSLDFVPLSARSSLSPMSRWHFRDNTGSVGVR